MALCVASKFSIDTALHSGDIICVPTSCSVVGRVVSPNVSFAVGWVGLGQSGGSFC